MEAIFYFIWRTEYINIEIKIAYNSNEIFENAESNQESYSNFVSDINEI